ncbi:MAG: L,D-transpeptidase family protein [Candidatus Berkiellales bacterium]
MLNQIKVTSLRKCIVATVLWIGALFSLPASCLALTFIMMPDSNVVGNVQYTVVRPGDSLATIAIRYNMGGYEMLEANPGVDYKHPQPGKRLVIPSRFVLPDTEKKGIVINLAEMRMYYYHSDGAHVSTYPIGVGQAGWNTPLGKTQITRKRLHPTWVVPDSIMAEHIAHGQFIPKVKGPGGDNPLGNFAMNTGFTSIVIHGTPFPKAVGVRSSHGCIRMTNENAGELFNSVKVGTPVNIIHQPTKIGKLDNKIYMEAHVPLSNELYAASYRDIGQMIHKTVEKTGQRYNVQWNEVERLQHRASGIPVAIGSLF